MKDEKELDQEDERIISGANTYLINELDGKKARIALRCINEGVSLRAALKIVLAH